MSATQDLIGTETTRVRVPRMPAGPTTVLELARVQTRRILRHPALLVSLVWLVLGVGFGRPGTPYEQWTRAQLIERAKAAGVRNRTRLSKAELISALRAG